MFSRRAGSTYGPGTREHRRSRRRGAPTAGRREHVPSLKDSRPDLPTQIGLVLLYGVTFELFLVWHPGGQSFVALVDTLATFVGLLLALVLTIGVHPRSWLSGYLAVYPAALLALLFLPGQHQTPAARMRIALDGLLIIAALIAFSWYYAIGPTIFRGGATLAAKVIGSAFPIGDLILSFCLISLWLQARDRALDSLCMPIALGLVSIVVGDSILDYQLLHGTSPTLSKLC